MNQIIKINTHTGSHVSRIFLSFILTIFLALCAIHLLKLYPIKTPLIKNLTPLFIKKLQHGDFLYPKPKEIFIMNSIIILLPFIMMIAIILVDNIYYRLRNAAPGFLFYYSWIMAAILLLLTAITTHVLYYCNYLKLLLNALFHLNWTLSFLSILSIALTLYLSGFLSGFKKNKKYFKQKTLLVVGISIFMIFFQSFSFRVPSIYIVNHHLLWTSNFNAVFYSMAQVMAGKTLLFNLPAQYGLYAELLKPLFSLLGLSVFKFTLVMAFLEIMGLLALLMVLVQLLKSRLLILLAILSLCLDRAGVWMVVNYLYNDQYYQYDPIRFFFPAISILLFLNIIKKMDAKKVILFSVIAALSSLWNIDTGVPIIGAFLSYLLAQSILGRAHVSRFYLLKLLGFAITTILFVLLVFAYYLRTKAGAPIHFGQLLQYQHTFYILGFLMIPLPRGGIYPWHIIFMTYLFGMCAAFYNWFKGYHSLRWDTVFYISVLGIGLFVYYTGRAHIYNLIAVSWPAFLLMFIFVDWLLRMISLKKLPLIFMTLCLPMVTLSVLLASNYLYGLPTLYRTGHPAWLALYHQTPNTTVKNIVFIKKHLHGDQSAFIAAPNQAVYYGELGLEASIDGASETEIILQSDYDELQQELRTKALQKSIKHIFIQKNKLAAFAKNLPGYRIAAASPSGLLYITY
ncbi:MAG: hypothetical protein ACD_60C00119G0004 [uncultured bacterium]|nr:MAG: hypothetical protein ACD_60C00119G0004 [uncultured bacterium]